MDTPSPRRNRLRRSSRASSGSSARSSPTRLRRSSAGGALTWGILGIILGPIALFALYLLPHHHVEGSGSAKKADKQAALYEVPKKKR